jgi:hypothetical protein
MCLASVSQLILLLSVSSAFANWGDTEDEAIKVYGQSIGRENCFDVDPEAIPIRSCSPS